MVITLKTSCSTFYFHKEHKTKLLPYLQISLCLLHVPSNFPWCWFDCGTSQGKHSISNMDSISTYIIFHSEEYL